MKIDFHIKVWTSTNEKWKILFRQQDAIVVSIVCFTPYEERSYYESTGKVTRTNFEGLHTSETSILIDLNHRAEIID
jgi:hypothetical protein